MAGVTLSSCKEKVEQKDDPVETGWGYPKSTGGWDIYKAGNYRYGPSFIINDDGSIDAWFSAVGSMHGMEKVLLNSTGESEVSAVHQIINGPAGQYFKIDREFYAVQVRCPSWSSAEETITFKLFAWKNSYAETVSGKPLSVTTKEKYQDNSWISVFYNEDDHDIKAPAGEYLWVADAGTSKASVWGCNSSSSSGGLSPLSFKNGKPVENYQFESRVALEYTEGTVFWDQITYQHSDDGGKTWTAEVNALQPTEFSEDSYSCCDPGVAKWGGWYYIAYTSTRDTRGTDNNVYVARSKNPAGPWDKWNGSGWGGFPAPAILYNGKGSPDNYGAGEPCIVVVDNTVYFYYSWNDPDPITKLSTAPANDENWPAALQYKGIAIDKSDKSWQSADHSDVKYRTDLKKFVAVNTAKRMTSSSFIQMWVSTDGLDFKYLGKMTGTGFKPGLHNCGWTGDALGHQDPEKQQYIGYAYGLDTWGRWNTWFAPLSYPEVKKE